MDKKINNWMTKTLSFAGRLQLINSVLSAMHIYWASVFIIPARVINDLEKRMRRFLWNVGNIGKVKAKVAWNDVCLPKQEGGLGIRRVGDVNRALITNHIWSILVKRKSLWVQWIYDYKVKDQNYWEIQCRGSMSWGWRKILSIRNIVRSFVWKVIRSGRQTNAWSDNWCHLSPLRAMITPRRIANAGFNLSSSVADLLDSNGQWNWPQAWYDLYPVLIGLSFDMPNPQLQDLTVWKDLEGNQRHFSSLEVWHNIRTRDTPISWANMVWRNVRAMVDMDTVPGSWASILAWMEQHSNSNTLDRVVCKLVVAAATYFIWQERNNRLFNRIHGSVSQVAEKIKHIVQLRLMDFKLQKHVDYNRVVTRWQIPARALNEDPG
ncbi:uncharacterized protein LOC110942484 [Helianthus annuus]|uniref:uncharacterized protein LOC110942484 n=1 Tax=Helianthus annuus TaxID=4232 RepID=UPI000B90A081|nr:uncharacterized protein LOC110942484 [Helianthus annuus]